MIKLAFISVLIASFFALIGQESRINPRSWAMISFGSFWSVFLLSDNLGFPGLLLAVLSQVALFIGISVVWVIAPRKSSQDVYDQIEKSRLERENKKLMNNGQE